MMMKIIFMFLIVGIGIGDIVCDTSMNCSQQNPLNRTNECIFQCIQLVYDKKYCDVCPGEENSSIFSLNKNETFKSLVQHNTITFLESSQSLAARQCRECSDNETGDFLLERYFKPVDLVRLFNCTRNLSTTETTSKTNCTSDEIVRLYKNVTQRVTQNNWCIDALGLKALNISINDAIIEMEKTKTTTEASVPTTEATLIPVTEEIIPSSTTIQTIKLDEETTSTTTVVKPTEAPHTHFETTTKTAKKKIKIVEEHHYMGSVTIICIIVGVILAVMMVSVIILRVHVARQKNRIRSSSTTYVFEAH